MRPVRIIAALLFAVTVAMLTPLAAPAWAASTTTPVVVHVSPSPVVAGHTVTVSGSVGPDNAGSDCASIILYSDAFAPTNDLGYMIAVYTTAKPDGTFTATTMISHSKAAGTYPILGGLGMCRWRHPALQGVRPHPRLRRGAGSGRGRQFGRGLHGNHHDPALQAGRDLHDHRPLRRGEPRRLGEAGGPGGSHDHHARSRGADRHDPARDPAAGARARGRRAIRPAGRHGGSPTGEPLDRPWTGSAWQRHAGRAGRVAAVPAAAPSRLQPAGALSHGALTNNAHSPARAVCRAGGVAVS